MNDLEISIKYDIKLGFIVRLAQDVENGSAITACNHSLPDALIDLGQRLLAKSQAKNEAYKSNSRQKFAEVEEIGDSYFGDSRPKNVNI